MATHVTTSIGFECDVDEAAVNDFKLLKILRDIQTGKDPLAVVDLAEKLLSQEDEDRLLEACSDERGRADITMVSNALSEIFTGLGQTKK